VAILLVITSVACERVEYYPDKPGTFEKTRVLGHRGGGLYDAGNTMESCKRGLNMLDGIEIDIQKGADNVLWLSHSSSVLPCGSFTGRCFASLNSSSIIDVDSCLGNSINYTPLEAVFEYISIHHPDKFVSLDVKAWEPCEFQGINITSEMNALGEEIIHLTVKYHLENRVMVESETGDFLYYVKKKAGSFIETYLLTLGDFELGASRALRSGFSGISFEYNAEETIVKEQVDMLHRKGLKIQLWTIDDDSEMDEARALSPDFIQTDVF
jgi:glycerophosphoryl diester phosphodiesterase